MIYTHTTRDNIHWFYRLSKSLGNFVILEAKEKIKVFFSFWFLFSTCQRQISSRQMYRQRTTGEEQELRIWQKKIARTDTFQNKMSRSNSNAK